MKRWMIAAALLAAGAASCRPAEEGWPVLAVLSNDMIGNVRAGGTGTA